MLSLGSQAEYGSFSGAAIDVITRSGSNEFHGSVAYYGQVGDASNRLQLYVLGPDLKARGLSEENVMDCIEVVDYDGFVDLVVGHDATHACL